MHHSQLLLWIAFLRTSSALPLNINLGAYSPALVVGDGEISFAGNTDVSNLMNALQGAAVSGAAANGVAAPGTTVAVPGSETPPASPSTEPVAAAVAPATQDDTQITALQGMGKEIAPRVISLVKSEKRDINGFTAALNYAADAIKTTPKIELGTEAAGVGILQNAGIDAPADSAAAAAEKRDDHIGSGEAKLRTTVTTMFVRGGPSPAQAEARNVEDGSAVPIGRRGPAPALSEGVNLNMAEGQVAELTFVETRAVGDDE